MYIDIYLYIYIYPFHTWNQILFLCSNHMNVFLLNDVERCWWRWIRQKPNRQNSQFCNSADRPCCGPLQNSVRYGQNSVPGSGSSHWVNLICHLHSLLKWIKAAQSDTIPLFRRSACERRLPVWRLRGGVHKWPHEEMFLEICKYFGWIIHDLVLSGIVRDWGIVHKAFWGGTPCQSFFLYSQGDKVIRLVPPGCILPPLRFIHYGYMIHVCHCV